MAKKLRTSSQGGGISSNPEARGRGRSYIKVLQQRVDSLNIKRLLLIKENGYFKLRNLALFFVWEDARVWAH